MPFNQATKPRLGDAKAKLGAPESRLGEPKPRVVVRKPRLGDPTPMLGVPQLWLRTPKPKLGRSCLADNPNRVAQLKAPKDCQVECSRLAPGCHPLVSIDV